MTGIIKVDTIQNNGGTTGLTINSSGHVHIPGSVVQLAESSWTSAFSTSSTTDVAVTNATCNITPKFNDSKILIMLSTVWGMETWNLGIFSLFRDSTEIGSAGTRGAIRTLQNQVEGGSSSNSGGFGIPLNINYVDSPATTSQITYSLKVRADSGGPVHVGNRPQATGETVHSSLILMEIAQ